MHPTLLLSHSAIGVASYWVVPGEALSVKRLSKARYSRGGYTLWRPSRKAFWRHSRSLCLQVFGTGLALGSQVNAFILASEAEGSTEWEIALVCITQPIHILNALQTMLPWCCPFLPWTPVYHIH